MAFELGSIIARVKGDISDYRSKMNEAGSITQRFHTGLSKMAGAARTFVTGLTAIGTGLAAAAGFAIKSAASLEQTRTAFETMLGSGKKAGALMQELNKFAAETPFEFPELADAGKKLLAFGFAASDIVPNLRSLGDVAAGLGIPIGELSELYGKARVQGRLYMEDINQLTGRGIPVIQEFAKQFKVSEGEVRGLVEQGKIGFPQLQKAIKSMTTEGGIFAGGMLKQSKTLNGMISTLKDNIGAFARDLVGLTTTGDIVKGGLFDKIKNAAAVLLEWLEANKENIKKAISTAFEWIKDNLPLIASILGVILVAAFASAAAAVGSFLVAMAPLIAAGAAVALAFQLLQPYFDEIGTWIQTVGIPAFQGFLAELNKIWQIALPFFKAAWEAIQPILAFIGDLIINVLWPAIQNLFKELKKLWDLVSPVLIPALIVLAAILGGVVLAAIIAVIGIITGLVAIITAVIWIFNRLWEVVSAVVNWIGNAIADLVWAIIDFFTRFGTHVANVWNGIKAGAAAAWNWVKQQITNAINTGKAIIGTIVGYVRGQWNTLNSVIGTVVNFFKTAFNNGVNAVKGIVEKITGFVKGVVDKIGSVVSGVKDAITAPFKAAVDVIRDLMGKAGEYLNNLNPFQRHSPSLVDWVKRGTATIADEYNKMNNAIAAGSMSARIQAIGTARTVSVVDTNALSARDQGGRGDIYQIDVSGVLADSPAAKLKFGEQIVAVINDKRKANGGTPI